MFGQFLENTRDDQAMSGNSNPLYDPGKYAVRVTDASSKRSDSGWTFVKFQLTIQGGKFDGKKVFLDIPVQGAATEKCSQAKADEMAEEGRSKLLGFLIACGVQNPRQASEQDVMGKSVTIKLYHKNGREGKENAVSNWEKAGNGQGGAASKPAMPQNGHFGAGARAQAPLAVNKGSNNVGAASQGVQQQSQANISDDDIPI